MSAFPFKADIWSAWLFDHLVGADQHRLRDLNAECLGRSLINHKIKYHRLFDRQVARPLAFKEFINEENLAGADAPAYADA
jgi:hypothetical protein